MPVGICESADLLPAASPRAARQEAAPLDCFAGADILLFEPPPMRVLKWRRLFWAGISVLILSWATALGPEPPARIAISSDELVRAVALGRDSLVELCLMEKVDPNGRDAQGRTPLLLATMRGDWKTAQKLVNAGARVDLADRDGLTPLTAAAMHGNLAMFQVLRARSADLRPEAACKDGRDLLGMALDGGNPEIVRIIVEQWPAMSQWRSSTRRALRQALVADDKEQIRQLLSKHSSPPTPEGKKVPLLAYAIAQNNSPLFDTLLACGADPNTVLPPHCDADFLALIPSKSLRSYIEEDRGLTVLMLAAGLGQDDYARALLQGGASHSRLTSRDKMSALDIAAETGHWRAAQILLGGGPPPDKLRIEISLALQRVALLKNNVPVYRAHCSTGRPGYSTKRGEFVVTNKERYHRSTIYHVDMPYFMRLSCLDFGMHAGFVPNYPASHGCIRLPEETARKFFSEIPVGTVVTIN